MSFPRRGPRKIALELLNFIDEKKSRATKWDLVKILGNEAQFHHWIDDFLIKEKFVEETVESQHYFYNITERGALLQRLLRNGDMIEAMLRISGRRLRNN
jgi:predicted transcriptional regulator